MASPVGRDPGAPARARARAPRRGAGGALRVVTLHHHLIGAPWRSRKKPVARRSHVLASLVDAGAELILAGHIHQGAVSERHEFEVIRGDVRGVVVSIAPGLGQPRPQRRGEARGLHVYECDETSILVQTYIWRSDDWGLTAVRRFARGREPLVSRSGRLDGGAVALLTGYCPVDSSRMIEPTIAVSHVLMSKNSSSGSASKSTPARNPPISAPATPMMMVTMMPPGSSPGRIALAMIAGK